MPRVIVFLACLSVLASLPARSGEEPQGGDPHEPNNTREQARAIEAGAELRFAVDPRGDVDWFRLTLPKPGYLRFKAEPSGVEHLTPQAMFLDENGKELGLHEARLRAGTAYVRVEDDWNNASSPKLLKATVEFIAEEDPSEPNDRPETARRVALGEDFRLAIMPCGDVDWLEIEAPLAGYLEFVPGKSPVEGLNLNAAFRDETGRASTVGQPFRLSGPGRVRVKVNDDWDDRSSPNLITCRIVFRPEFDPQEPNDEPALAGRMACGEWRRVALCPDRDQDWFRVEAPGSGYLIPEFMEVPADKLTPEVQFVDAKSRKPLPSSNSTGAAVKPGLCLVRLTAAWETPWAWQPFLFRLRFVPEFDELEAERPPLLQFGKPVRIGFCPRGDQDLWRLQVDKPGLVWLTFPDRPQGFGLQTEIRAPNAPPRTAGETFRLTPGVYVLKAGPSNPDWWSPRAIRMLPVLEEEFDPFEPNDTAAEAKPLPLNQPVSLFLYPGGDQDWFTVDLGQDGLLQVTASDWGIFRASNRDCLILTCLYASDGKTQVAGISQSSYGPRRTAKLKKGTYLLQVAATNDWAFSRQPFTLHAEFLPDGAPAQSPVSAGNLTVAFAGLQLPEGERGEFEVLTRSSRALFVDSGKTRSIEEAVQKATLLALEKARTEEKREAAPESGAPAPPSAPCAGERAWLACAVIVLALAALTGILLLARRKRAGEPPADLKPGAEKPPDEAPKP